MNQEEFEKKMQIVDAELIKKGIPLKGRPLNSLSIFCPNSMLTISPGNERFYKDFEGPNLFGKIQAWYENRYSQKMLSDFKIGVKPFKIRGEIYYMKYPVVYGSQGFIDVLDFVEDLTADMRNSLTENEQNHILENFKLGYETFNKVQGLDCLSNRFQSETTNFILRGIIDLEAASSLIIDAQNTIFHAHQAAEKFLKALLIESNYQAIAKKHRDLEKMLSDLGHSLLKIYNKLPVEKLPKRMIRPQVKYLHKLVPSMDVRYKDVNKSLDEAICSIDNMLKICKFSSEQIILIHSFEK